MDDNHDHQDEFEMPPELHTLFSMGMKQAAQAQELANAKNDSRNAVYRVTKVEYDAIEARLAILDKLIGNPDVNATPDQAAEGWLLHQTAKRYAKKLSNTTPVSAAEKGEYHARMNEHEAMSDRWALMMMSAIGVEERLARLSHG